MKHILLLFLIGFSVPSFAQKEKIEIPARVAYKYCKPKLYLRAKELVHAELTEKPNYSLCDRLMFVGPVLWTRIGKLDALSKIEGGNVSLHVDQNVLKAKLTQSIEDSKKIWNQIRTEVEGKNIKLRKATVAELEYFWSVISYDIEEPLIIAETLEHTYILDLLPKTLKLIWLDEVPR